MGSHTMTQNCHNFGITHDTSSMENSPTSSPRMMLPAESSTPHTAHTARTSRRTSFLSQKMIDNESFSIYDSYTFTRGASSHHIISLKESQGFLFNQDLFASTYQQSRTLLREKQARALTSKKRSQSYSSSSRWKMPSVRSQRRHTSYGSGPSLRRMGDDLVVDEGSSNDMCVDDELSETVRAEGNPPSTLAKAFILIAALIIAFDHILDHSLDPHRLRSSRVSGSKGIHTHEVFDEESDGFDGDGDGDSYVSDGPDFAPFGANYVPVIDISVDDMDHIPDI
ncbi:hypothetical protein JCM33374_g1783 [Metschnikowia sp. JCM 33374]|nr:hypothetical protein JCM33374_g1783 [Metschnikowia sp. JCM 33374]